MPVSTVAERLRPESLFDRFVSYREQLGMEVIALSGAGNPTLALKSSLEEGG
jgi:KDO2-lipid IV(A) lauroyltransferase